MRNRTDAEDRLRERIRRVAKPVQPITPEEIVALRTRQRPPTPEELETLGELGLLPSPQ